MTSAPDPAASTRAPVASRRAALPGGPAAPGSPPLAAGGKTSRRAGSPSHLPDGTRTSSRATPRDQASRDGTREEVPQSPAGGELPSNSPPAGSRGLRGTEWQAAVKLAQRRQPGRGALRAAAKVTIPPPATGAALTATATCLGRCDWTAGPGDPAEVDKAAEKHTAKPPKHPTNTVSVAAEIGGAAA